MKNFYIYILASSKNGTLYIGVTNDLTKRVAEHKNGEIPGFTRDYNVDTLVYFELTESAKSAIAREKQLKNWRCDWKIALIENNNPGWQDLFTEISGSRIESGMTALKTRSPIKQSYPESSSG